MRTKLDELLERIHPDRTITPFAQRVDDAVKSFECLSSRIESSAEFRQVMTAFHHHMVFKTLALPLDCIRDDETEWGLCQVHLAALCGTPGMALKIARLGISGGLYGLFRGIAQRMVEEHTKNQIGAAVTAFWNALSAEELVAASQEYVDKHGHLWPGELREMGGVALRMNFVQVLREHPFVISRLKGVGG